MQYLAFLIYLLFACLAIGFVFGMIVGCVDKYTGFLTRWWRFVFYIVFFGALYWLETTGLFLDEIKAKEQMAQLCDPKNASTKVMPKEAYGKTVRIEQVISQMDTAIPVEHYQYNHVDTTTGQVYFISDMYIADPGWFGRLLAKHQMYDGSSGPSKFRRICVPDVMKTNAKELHEKYQITLIE